MRITLSLSIFLCFILNAMAQEDVGIDVSAIKDNFRIQINKTSDKITLDGKLEEGIWSKIDPATDFWQKSPFVKVDADPRTEVFITYDDNNLYVGAKAFQSVKPFIHSLRRDEYWDSDGVCIVLDPLNTKANSYLFGVTAGGVQMEALRTETSDINRDWNNKWFSNVHHDEGFWSVEMAIPLKILRYDPSLKEWGVNFIRNVTHENEFHSWTSIPIQNWPVEAAFAGTMTWDNPPAVKKGNFNIIPYAISSVTSRKDEELDFSADAGVDAKIAITPTLNLDITVNPDFSQVEVDELVTNLTRFSIFLPEKRNFFLENGDIFADYGFGGVRPFFSRTIGLDENRNNVPILYGLRLNGNITPDLRIGAMNIHSATTDDANGQNQSAFSLQKKFGRSFVQGMFLNRQAFDGSDAVQNDFGRNASLEGAYITNDGKYSLWGGMHKSFKEGLNERTWFLNQGFNYTSPSFDFLIDNVRVEDNYYADMGFIARINNYDAERDTVLRLGFNQTYAAADYKIQPKGGNVAQHRFGFENFLVYNMDWSFNERFNRLRYFINLKSGQSFKIRLDNRQENLQFPFSFTDGEPLPAGTYKSNQIILEYDSDERKALSYSLSSTLGGFYNGNIKRFEVNTNYRVQPWGNFGFGYQYNDLSFPDEYGESTIQALVSKIEIGFSTNLLWTTLFQYVDQSEYMGINSRLQYRFAPMSDLFLVYLDNYDVLSPSMGGRDISNNNRSLILKVSYWY